MNLTRRDFAKLSTLALASRFAPNLRAQTSAPRKTGYCVIGLGRIAGHFMPAVRNTTTSQITGLVSGHRDKAERIAAEYGVPSNSIYNYENFDEIAHNPAIDAVYVALPNSMHAEYTIRAAKAGKHVLCEKPMSTSVADAEAMIAACKAARVKLMIAYRCHYEPTNLKAVQLIRDGCARPGADHREHLRLQHRPRRMAAQQETRRRWPTLRCRNLLSQRMPLPHRRRAGAHHGQCLRHRPRRPLQRSRRECLLDHEVPLRHRRQLQHYLWRQHGRLLSRPWIERLARSRFGLRLRRTAPARGLCGGKLDEPNPARDPSHFQAEAEHFSHCIQNGLEPQSPGEEGLRDMRYITQIYRSAGIAI